MSGSLTPADDAGRALRPPQFGLRTLLLVMTLCSVAFACFAAIGWAWSAMVVFFAALVGCHVLGNALGTRLRDGDGRIANPQAANQDAIAGQMAEAVALAARPAERFHENTKLRRPWLFVAAVTALIGGTCGGFALMVCVGDKLTPAGLATGIGSSAVIGGLAGFMLSSLYSVFRSAWREAVASCDS